MQWTDFLLIGLLLAAIGGWLGYRALGPKRVQKALDRVGGQRFRVWIDCRLGWVKASLARAKRPTVGKLPPEAVEKKVAADVKKRESLDTSKAAAESLKRFRRR